jgi:hypothetical protein
MDDIEIIPILFGALGTSVKTSVAPDTEEKCGSQLPTFLTASFGFASIFFIC